MTVPIAKNQEVGKCECPICHAPGARVRVGAGGHHYINCDGCVTLIRSMSRAGSDLMFGLIGEQHRPAPAPAPGAGDPAPKRGGGFLDALAQLGGSHGK